MKDYKIQVATTLDKETLSKVKAKAKNDGMTLSNKLRHIIINHFENFSPTSTSQHTFMEVLKSLPKRFSTSEARKAYSLKGFSSRTSDRVLKKMLEKGELKRVKTGVYERVW